MKVLQELTAEIDPKDLEKMYSKSPLGRILGPALKMLGGGRNVDPKVRERKREEKRRWGRSFGLEASFRPLGERLSRSVVTILLGGKAVGYGVVVSEGGEVVTNDRILGDAPFGVRVGVGRERRAARVLGRHGLLDVALLKIAPAGLDLTPAVFGNSGALGPGDWLVTAGPPSRPVLAVGAVSAMEREIGRNRKIPTVGLMGLFGKPNESPLREYPEVIQHDSKIVKGFFGSPVFNARGYLVGINVANFYRGSSYATPVSRIAPVLDELRSGLSVKPPPFLEAKVPDNPMGGFGEGDMGKIFEQFKGGKFFEDLRKWFEKGEGFGGKDNPLNDMLKKFLEGQGGGGDFGKMLEDMMKRLRGSGESETKPPAAVLGIRAQDTQEWGTDVIRVNPGSGAEKAGMRVGDRIVALDGGEVAERKDLLRLLRRKKPGDRVTVTVMRAGKKVRLVVILGKRPPRGE
jgi:S1-C subfamily serine protease